jgi:hypothetical protein
MEDVVTMRPEGQFFIFSVLEIWRPYEKKPNLRVSRYGGHMKKNQICAFLDMAAISPKQKKWKNWLLEDVDRKTKG